jgi:hypothetical protein
MCQIITKNYLTWQSQTTPMSYHDFVSTYDRVERTKHINHLEIELDIGHTHAVYKSSGPGARKEKAGQILDSWNQSQHAIANLKKFILDTYNIDLIGPQTQLINLCHLCKNNSKINNNNQTKHVCTSPYHVYFGSASENANDIEYNIMIKGAQSQLNSGIHNTQIKDQCIHCGWVSTEFALNNHVKACHFNPNSKNYLKPITRSDRIKGYKKQNLEYKLIELKSMIIENQ